MSCQIGDVIDFVGPYTGESGTCTEGNPQGRSFVIGEINKAIPILLSRLDSKGTLFEWKVCVNSQTFTLPYDCLEPRQAWLNNQSLVQRDEFYQGQLGVGQNSGAPWVIGGNQLIDLGDGFSLPYDWPNHTDTHYGLVAENNQDAGTVVRVRLLDQHGSEVFEDITLLPDQQVAVSQNIVTNITYQHKGQTNGAVRGYIVYPQLGTTAWIGTFPGVVIVPSYRKKKIPANYSCNGFNGGSTGTLVIKGKLRYFPVRSELDPIPISNALALGYACQTLYLSRNGERQAANEALEFAVNELERELQDNQSNSTVTQIQVMAPWGRNRFARAWR